MKNNRKNKMNPRYVLIALGILCVVGIGISVFKGGMNGSKVVSSLLAPMQTGMNDIGQFTAGIAKKHQTQEELESENERLNTQIDELKAKITAMENNLSDYNNLLSLMSLSEKYPSYDTIGARIISKDAGNWYDTFVINKGSVDGIDVDMNVIADNGLVGIVTQVNLNSAVVRSIIDDASTVSGMISKNMDTCIVNGDLKLIDSGLLSVEMISNESTVVDGDEVVTSYISDKYLPGIMIGYITDLKLDESELSYNAQLTPIVDFQHLSNVLVIKQLKKDFDTSTFTFEPSSETQQTTETTGAES